MRVYSPTMIELFGNAGLDFVFVDLEHCGFSPWDSEKLEEYGRAADVSGIDLLVRLPSGEAGHHPPLIRKVFDAGIRNVLIPRIDTAEEARRAVEAGKLQYDGEGGKRGIGGGRANDWLGLSEGYVEREDASTQVGVMIENKTAVENLDDILSVPELGFVAIGPADLSVSMGYPGETDAPEVQDVVTEIREKVVSAGVPLTNFGLGKTDLQGMIEDGCQILTLGTDSKMIHRGISEKIEEAEHAMRESGVEQ
jgi:2-dehydro-3-deoxyglucarate aldolase